MQAIKPSGVVIGVSDYCPNKCQFCFIWQRPVYPQELSIAEWKDFISSLKGWVDDPFKVSFTGGEPLAREGIVELVACAHDLGFETYITTSGNCLTPGLIKRLSDAGLNTITFSLETLNQQKHDRLCGVPGLSGMIMSAIEDIKQTQPAINIGINTIILKENLEDIPDLVKWVMDNPKIGFIGFEALMHPHHSAEDPFWFRHAAKALWPDDIAKVDLLLDGLIEVKQKTQAGPVNKIGGSVSQFKAFKAYFRNPNRFVKNVKCRIFNKPVCITPHGGIGLCSGTGDLGNIRQGKLQDIWNEKIGECVQKISGCKTPCAGLVNCYCWDACVEEDLLSI